MPFQPPQFLNLPPELLQQLSQPRQETQFGVPSNFLPGGGPQLQTNPVYTMPSPARRIEPTASAPNSSQYSTGPQSGYTPSGYTPEANYQRVNENVRAAQSPNFMANIPAAARAKMLQRVNAQRSSQQQQNQAAIDYNQRVDERNAQIRGANMANQPATPTNRPVSRPEAERNRARGSQARRQDIFRNRAANQ